jgi:D-alanyl-lipoteichoic acid acyltransferase DltB (MBOAT superfamily)
MLFSSYIFLFVFLPPTLVGFCLLSRWVGPKPAKLWLTLASLVFYGWWNPVYVVLILASMLFNFWLGGRMGRVIRSGRSGRPWLFWGVAANLLLLGYFKYANFFVSNIDALWGTDWTLGKIVLPLGISFFTFTQIAYLADVSRGVVCEYNLGDFLLFITFFPHLIAGPIIHHSEMMPQFAEPRTYRFDWENLAVGLGIFALGLFKKVVIADSLSGHVAKVFGAAAAGSPLYALDAWAGVLSYTFQIYFDFSGYSDMAIALARMFGITLPLNFNSPYKAVNIIEFWRRWHMTLSRFLRDYLYIPLGGNRHGPRRRYVNLLVTMGLGGLWHGASWTFVLWGLFHGICLAVNHLWQGWWGSGRSRVAVPSWLIGWPGRVLTFFLVVLGWVLFRAADLPTAHHILAALFGLGATPAAGIPALLKPKTWYWLAGLLAFVWLLPNSAELHNKYQPYPAILKDRWAVKGSWWRWQMNPAWACFAALLLAVAVLSLSRAGEFLYYNF